MLCVQRDSFLSWIRAGGQTAFAKPWNRETFVFRSRNTHDTSTRLLSSLFCRTISFAQAFFSDGVPSFCVSVLKCLRLSSDPVTLKLRRGKWSASENSFIRVKTAVESAGSRACWAWQERGENWLAFWILVGEYWNNDDGGYWGGSVGFCRINWTVIVMVFFGSNGWL